MQPHQLPLRFTAIDYEIDERSENLLFGSKCPSASVEYWSLQRTVGTQSTECSIAEKKCPRCGTPLAVNEIGECQHSKAAATSGAFDWILSRITQANE